ncbi:MAG: GNAT family N-acetyltransferase [Acidobacteriota bacterium]|nr:MAG: GNAT family N-acetyltransferase [Acidobacteriota bacterium]
MFTIRQAESDTDIDEVRKIFREYEKWLGFDLCFQGFEQELAELPGKYAQPEGRLLIAETNGEIAGVVAMRNLGARICEMKRLYVREIFRGQKIGETLISRIIAEAKSAGYSAMRLDTYPPKMKNAVDLYRSHGFEEIERYYDNPNSGTLFMELKLFDQ